MDPQPSNPPGVPPEITFVSLPLPLAQFHHLPRHVPVWLHRQEVVEKGGYDFTEGARVMEELLQAAPSVPGAYLYQLFVRKWPMLLAVNPFFASGRVAEAIPKLVEVLEVDPECPLTCFQLGFCFRATGELERSESFYKQALRMAPEAGWIHSNLGRTYLAMGDRTRAVEAFWTALDLLPSDGFVLEQLTELKELFPIPEKGGEGKVSFVRRADYEKKAREILAEEKDPQALTQTGWKLLRDGLFPLADAFFEKAERSPAAPAAAKLGRARVLLEQGKPAEAEKLLLEFLEKEPASAPGHLALFKAYLAQGETDLAWEEIQSAARSDPSHAETLRSLQRLFAEAGRLEEGLDWFTDLHRAHPGSAPPLWRRIHCLLDLDRGDEVRPLMEEALALPEPDEEVLLRYTADLGAKGEAQAIVDLLGPKERRLSFALTINLALAHARLKVPGEAKRVLEVFLQRPDLPALEAQRGRALLQALGEEA